MHVLRGYVADEGGMDLENRLCLVRHTSPAIRHSSCSMGPAHLIVYKLFAMLPLGARIDERPPGRTLPYIKVRQFGQRLRPPSRSGSMKNLDFGYQIRTLLSLC